jgi:hypothetical protein
MKECNFYKLCVIFFIRGLLHSTQNYWVYIPGVNFYTTDRVHTHAYYGLQKLNSLKTLLWHLKTHVTSSPYTCDMPTKESNMLIITYTMKHSSPTYQYNDCM